MHINFSGYNAERLIQYLDFYKIDQCWLLTWEEQNPPIPSLYQHLSVEEIFEAYNKFPDRIVPFYAPDPSSPQSWNKFDQYIKLGLKGCGELKATFRWDEKEIENYLKRLSGYKLPLVFHMEKPRQIYLADKKNPFKRLFRHLLNNAFNGVTGYYITKLARNSAWLENHIAKNTHYFPGYLYDFENLEKRLSQFPEITFIGHGPHFWNNISRDLSIKYTYQKGKINDFGIVDNLLEKYDNFYCDVSGTSGFTALTRDPKQSKIFLEKHAGKILFGTDNTRYDFVQFLTSLKIDPLKLERIFYKNAETIIST